MLSPRKHKDRGLEFYEKINTEGVESYENIKTKGIESYETSSTKGLNLMRKREIDSLRGPLILNLKYRTLDLGNGT